MKGNLEFAVLFAGLGCFSYNVVSSLQGSGIIYGGTLVIYILLTGFLQQQFTIEDELKKFRILEPGLLYCLLFPLAVCLCSEDEGRFITVLIPMSLLLFIGECKGTFYCNMMASLVCIGLIGHIVLYNWSELALTLMLCLVYTMIVQILPMCFHKTFSFGELSIICQMYIYMMYSVLRAACSKQVDKQESQAISVTEKAAAAIFITLNVLVPLICILKWIKATTVQALTTVTLSGIISVVCVVYWVIPPSQIKILVMQLLGSKLSVILLLWWICCTIISLLIVCYYGNRNGILTARKPSDIDSLCKPSKATSKSTQDMYDKQADNKLVSFNEKSKKVNGKDIGFLSTQDKSPCGLQDGIRDTKVYKPDTVPMVVRKYFHVVILAVYVPGLLFDHNLLYVASCVAAAVFLFVETVRVCDVPVIGNDLNKYLAVFLDKQDQGDLILTPIYLLIGCSLPLWIVRPKFGTPCTSVHYSGLLSVGVGDAAASVIGRKFGQHRWPGSNKTVEGTFAAFLSQIIFLVILHYAGVPRTDVSIATLLIIMLVSCLEAFTHHIDNLVVPLFTSMLFFSIQFRQVNEVR